jgi:hypothetical protein
MPPKSGEDLYVERSACLMALVLNLPGAVQQVATAKSNVERVEAVCRLTEEFYKTVGILLYGRFARLEGQIEEPAIVDVRILVKNHLSNPSFGSWQRLVSLCGDVLVKSGDPLATKLVKVLREPLREDQAPSAGAALRQIATLRKQPAPSVSKPTRRVVLEAMRELRNFRGHEWDNNELLAPLIRTGVIELITDTIRAIFGEIPIRLVVPVLLSEAELDLMVFDGVEVSRKVVAREEFPDATLGVTHYEWGSGSIWTENPTKLVKALGDQNRLFVYLKVDDAGAVIGEHLSLSGRIEKERIGGSSLGELFGLTQGDLDRSGQIETLVQRFARVRLTGECIHNVPPVAPDYVERAKVESELREKLSHRRLYITTIDGGGGFGKTELAKKVVWDLMESSQVGPIPETLRYKFVIFVTGKTEVFQEGEVRRTRASFSTVEDLLDSILYVTGSPSAIQLAGGEKTTAALTALNKSPSTLLLLDNLDTVPERDDVWRFLKDLGNLVTSDLHVLTTSRLRGDISEQRLNLRKMEPAEALQLAVNEAARLDLPARVRKEGVAEEIVTITGSIPLLIRHSYRLLTQGYTMEDLRKNVPANADQALNFICGLQWSRLGADAQKLLLSVAYWGGRQSFADARLITSFSDKDLALAREQLQSGSFLLDDFLLDSMFCLLPPITQFALLRLREHPKVDEEFGRAKRNIVPSDSATPQALGMSPVSTEIALTQIFTRADLLTQRGEFAEAHRWHVVATDRFPGEVSAWCKRADFEFRHIDDEALGTQSFERAHRVDPQDLTTLSNWAYWEFMRGVRHQDALALQHSVELRSQLLSSTVDVALIRNSRLHIARAYLKLAHIAREEARNPSVSRARTTSFIEKEEYVLRAIKVLDEAVVDRPRGPLDLQHNCAVLALRAEAFLDRGDRRSAAANDYTLEALHSIIKGLGIDQGNRHLISLLNHPFLRPVLERYNGGPLRGQIPIGFAISLREAVDRDLRKR